MAPESNPRGHRENAMKTDTIQIVNHGRGPQLSTSRITVQDLLPYYREGASNQQIRQWIPSLTDDEIAILKEYIRDQWVEVMQAEQEIKAYHNRLKAAQPAWTRANDHLSMEERRARLREKLAQWKAEQGRGDHSPG
jgi:uncharacterized protein (DUF433 family)